MIGWLLTHLKAVAYAVAAGLIAAAVFFIRQSGADAEKAKQAAKDLKAASTIAQKRNEAQAATNAELDEEVKKWTRK